MPEPGPEPTLDDCAADVERQRLFRIIEELVKWENTTNEAVLDKARAEIWQSWRRACADNVGHPRAAELFNRHKLPAFHDPFAGGGALPLEAQRLGLGAYASDLNPVAVLINKAMIEIPPKFAGQPPVNPAARKEAEHGALRAWKGAQGLAADVRYYGQWMRDEAEKRIGDLYPKVEITPDIAKGRPDLNELVGEKLTIIAWLWARTVKSPNPAFTRVDVPLAPTFMLSTKAGKEAYAVPIIENGSYRFTVRTGVPMNAEAVKRGTKSGSSFLCLMSGVPMPYEYLRKQAKAGSMGARLMAMVAQGERGRVYLPPSEDMETIALSARPHDVPETDLPKKALGFRVQEYGMTRWRDLFSNRQLVTLVTFCDLVQEARDQAKRDGNAAALINDGKPLAAGGVGADAYADALAVYLAFALSKALTRNSTQTVWYRDRDSTMAAFSRQAIPMTWDFAEVNPLLEATGSIAATASWVAEVLEGALATGGPISHATQSDAATGTLEFSPVISTDPPYYDNIGYADLSDFFYVWLRRSLKPVFPCLFSTLAVPKAEELIAAPFRHGSKDKAEAFFLDGMTRAMHRLADQTHPAFPITIYYAFKQSETESDVGTANTGWETFLDAVIRSGLSITGTWPARTEQPHGLRVINTNSLASSIVLVCRKRDADAETVPRRNFLNQLKAELPEALRQLQRGNIAPVDLAQASIGPGMAVFTRYAKVVDAEGKSLTVRDALALINQVLDEVLAEQEGDFDADSRFAIAWFEQFGFAEGDFGVADVLARAKATSVAAMADPRGGTILSAKGGKVRLLKPDELPEEWDPAVDPRLTVWEMVHHLIRVLEADGESATGALAAKLGVRAEIARELAYRLYTVCERKKRAAEALSYNSLVQSWPEIMRLARETPASAAPAEPDLFA
ncbi:DUF1156 domain-containing protein [Methylocapsa palsarum]|uniref:Putative DNA methylase n=1 Tax=Methylocapsa palsarum TaxID=1612308 RepID=A0A1I4B630_9HYPH|nr:DUF1156 domain-containing protein [Methylocapsa palsarum]SFK63471.1 putative DNA methylase [Methylocapsa palsarum]